MLKRVGLWGFVLGGVAIAVWGAFGLLAPSTSCRGVEMGPGDVCHTSGLAAEDSGKAQRYEDRMTVARQQAPFIIGAGLAMATFGMLLTREGKRATG